MAAVFYIVAFIVILPCMIALDAIIDLYIW